MPANEIIAHLFQENDAREFLLDICNGVNTWLFRVLSNYQLTTRQARKECLILGQGIADHLQKIHGLKKYYNDAPGSFSKYLAENTEAGRFGLNYVVKTILSAFSDPSDRNAALVALLISEKKMEEEFENHRNRSPEADLREELICFYFYKRDELLDMGRSYQEKLESPLAMDADAEERSGSVRGFKNTRWRPGNSLSKN
jgi:hypothetical protein